jgi:hypothetical protein
MRTGNVMIGAVAKRISSKFEEGDRVKIAKEYGGGTGKVVQVVGGFVVVKTKRGDESYHSSDLKVINGIGAFKLISIPKSEINKMTQGQIFVKIMNHEKKRTYTNVTFRNLVNRLSYLETMDFKRYRKHSI